MAQALQGTLVGYWGGKAANGGATYEVEVYEQANGQYTVAYFSAAAGGTRVDQGRAAFNDRPAAFNAVLKKANDKRNPSKPRSYVLGIDRTRSAGQPTPNLPKKVDRQGHLPVHEQIWEHGRPFDTLPTALHATSTATTSTPGTATTPAAASVAAPTSASALEPASTPIPVAAPAPVTPTPEVKPALAPTVMLCETTYDAERYIADPTFLATRKVEGRRAGVQKRAGTVTMTNRSGEDVACPAHIAEAALRLPDGTALDGELVAMTADGREGLYAGDQPTQTLFIAFDVTSTPLLLEAHKQPQALRLKTLAQIVAQVNDPAIQIIEIATGTAAKRAMVERAIADQWEGVVFRAVAAPYRGGRSGAWVRFKTRKVDIDVVVLAYQDGDGKIAGTVGAVEVGLYDEQNQLISIGKVGSGFKNVDRAELQRRREAGQTGYVITVRTEKLSFNHQLVRPVFVGFRKAGDKQTIECTFSSELGALNGHDTDDATQTAVAA